MTAKGFGLEAGQKITMTIIAGEMPYGKIELPMTIISGSKPGPALAVTAGVHGSEYCAIVAAYKLLAELKPADLHGTLAMIPLVTRAAFENRTRWVNPVDGVNPNRAFPGKPDGSVSYQVAYHVFNDLILKSDAYVDMHGGDLMESLIPYAVFSQTGNSSVDKMSEEMVRSLGIKHVWCTPSARAPGGDSTEGGPWAPRGVAFAEAAAAGVPSILAEAGEDGKLDLGNVKILHDGILNVMKQIGMMEGKPVIREEPIISRKCVFIGARRGGVFYSYVKAGNMVKEKQLLGEIKNLDGVTLEEVRAPFTGILLAVVNNPAVKVSDDIYELLALS
jgi:predicted deacylase